MAPKTLAPTWSWILSCSITFPLQINYCRQVSSSFGACFTNSLLVCSCHLVGVHGSFPKVSPTSHKLVHLHMCHLEWWGPASASILHWPQPQHAWQFSATCGMTFEFFVYGMCNGKVIEHDRIQLQVGANAFVLKFLGHQAQGRCKELKVSQCPMHVSCKSTCIFSTFALPHVMVTACLNRFWE